MITIIKNSDTLTSIKRGNLVTHEADPATICMVTKIYNTSKVIKCDILPIYDISINRESIQDPLLMISAYNLRLWDGEISIKN